MTTPHSAKQPSKRRRCDNCNTLFRPGRIWAKFCSEKCRKEFHRYGSSYGPLKTGLHKAIDKKYAELRRDTTTALQNQLKLMGEAHKLLAVELKDQSRRIDGLESDRPSIV